MTLSSDLNAKFQQNLDAFEKIAGDTNDVGYIQQGKNNKLTKVAAHETLTKSDRVALKKLKANIDANKTLRRTLFDNIKASLANSIKDTESNAEMRLATLRFAATKLGIDVEFTGNDVDAGLNVRGASELALERRDVRMVLNVLNSKDFQVALLGERGAAAPVADHRKGLIDSMRKNFWEFDWKGVQLEKLSTASLENLTKHLLDGDIDDTASLRSTVETYAQEDPTHLDSSEKANPTATREGFLHRQGFIAEMKANHPEFNWSSVLLSRVSDQTIEQISEFIDQGEIKTTEDLQNVVERNRMEPTELGTKPTVGSLLKRDALIDEMRANFPQFKWERMPLERLSMGSLEMLADHLVQGDFPDSIALQRVVLAYADADFGAQVAPKEDDAMRGADSAERREALIQALKTHVGGIDWKQIPLGKLSNKSLSELGQLILKGQIHTMPEFKAKALDFAARDSSEQKINDENVLQRLEHVKAKDPNLVTFSPARGKSGAEEKLVYQQSERKSEPFIKPLEEDRDWFDEDGNRVSLKEFNAIKEDALKIPSESTVDGRYLSVQRVMDYSQILNNPGQAEMLVEHFVQELIEATGKDDATMFDVMMQHKRALVFISVAQQARFDAVFDAIPNGKLFKSAFASMREQVQEQVRNAKEEANLPKGLVTDNMVAGILHNKLLTFSQTEASLKSVNERLEVLEDDDEREDLLEKKAQFEGEMVIVEQLRKASAEAGLKIHDELKTGDKAEIDRIVHDDAKLKETFQSFRDDLRKHLGNAEGVTDPNAFVKGLISVGLDHLEALTILLTHTDKALPLLGGEAVLKPVIDNLKARLNKEILAGALSDGSLGLGADDQVDFFRPEFAGRIGNELFARLPEIKNSINLAPQDPVQAGLLKAGIEALKGALLGLPTIDEARIATTHAALGNVTEQDVRNTLADLVLEVETWNSDAESVKGERMQMMVMKNLDTLAVILCNPEKCAKMLGFPGAVEDMVAAFKETLSPIAMFFSPGNEAIARIMLGDAAANLKIENYAAIQEGVDEAVRQGMNLIQSITSHAFEALLKGENIGDFEDIMKSVEAEKNQIAQWKSQGINTDDPKVLEPLLKEYREEVSFKNSLKGLPEERRTELNNRRIQEKLYQERLQNSLKEGQDVYQALKEDISRIHEDLFMQDLQKMTLAEGAELWAKHNCFYKESRARFIQKLTEEVGADAMKSTTIEAFCNAKGGESFDRFGKNFIRENNLRMHKFKDPELMTEHEKSVLRLQESDLADIAGKGALDTNSGYGKFMVEVMKNYFNKVSDIDMKSMLSSLIRQGSANEIPPDATQEQADSITKDNIARQLGALFKGAGPVMQKLLQQLGSTQIADSFKLALDDMKSNLLPIPKEIVQAQLLSIVERYNDPAHLLNPEDPSHPLSPITNINVDKSLGAASVGQTLLCTVQCADGSSRKVAVKLLRPDAQNRIDREKNIFLEVARTVPGMEQTYLGRLERVLEEVDLTIEASNVKKGEVYDKDLTINVGVGRASVKQTHKDVHSMKLDAGIETTRDTMALECAPGMTVADILSQNDAKISEMRARLNAMPIQSVRTEIVSELSKMLNMLYPKVTQLAHLSFKWVEEGLFKSGFYHGDLHAGNIMVDTEKADGVDRGLTVIDFGNATALSKSDQGCIMRMVYGAQSGDADLFLDNYRTLMNPNGHARFDAVRKDAKALLDVIFSKGGESDAGQRILGAVTELQKLELELPAPIFNFSQCQILLQGTLEQVTAQLQVMNQFYSEVNDKCSHELMNSGSLGAFAPIMIQYGSDPKTIQPLIELWDRKTELFEGKLLETLNAMLGRPEYAPKVKAVFGEAQPTIEDLRKPEVQKKLLESVPEDAPKNEYLSAIRTLVPALQSWPVVRMMLAVPAEVPGDAAPQSAVQKLKNLNADVTVVEKEIDELDKQLQDLDDAASAMRQVAGDVILSKDNLEIDDPVLVNYLKGLDSKEAMLQKLTAEMNRIRGLGNKQTEKDRSEFPVLQSFQKALEKTPEGYLPRVALNEVRSALEQVPELKDVPNNIHDVAAAINQRLGEYQARDAINNKEPLRGFLHRDGDGMLPIQKLWREFNTLQRTDGSKKVPIGKDDPFPADVIKANYGVLKQMSEAAYPDRSTNVFLNQFPSEKNLPSITKRDFLRLINQIQKELQTMSSSARECSEALKLLKDAKAEIDAHAQKWPENTPVRTLPKLTESQLQAVGEPLTPQRILSKFESLKVELESSKEQAGDRLASAMDARSKNADFRDFSTFCDRLSQAEMYFGLSSAGAVLTQPTPSFLDVMGDVLNGHKLQAAMQVGLFTAAKELAKVMF